jgi:hypothetical protein
MYSPGRAILWQIYWRARWGFAAAAVFLCLSVALVHLLPTHWRIQMGEDQVPAAGWLLGVSCLYLNFVVMAAFGMSGAEARSLTFASHMFVLPVRTRTLVAWPMISGCITVVIVWLIDACLVFRPGGIAAPVWWPAAAFAALLVTFQALAWTPFAQRWLHIALTAGVLTSPLFVLIAALAFNVQLGEPAAAAVLLAIIPVAFVAAIFGLARARRGDAYDWRAWSRFVEWIARRRWAANHPFRSLSRAQLWYECRAHFIVPIFIACLMPCFLFVPAMDRTNVELSWRLLGIMLGTPLMVAMFAGGALGNLVDPFSKRESASFILVRPISSFAILRGKLLLAAIITAAIWILFLGYISLLLTRPGFPQSIARMASNLPAWKAIGAPILVLVFLMLFTWKNLIENLWLSLTGRKWVETAASFTFAGLTFVTIGIGLWIGFHPELYSAALAAVPWLIGVLLLLKLTAAVFVLRGVLRARLIGPAGAALLVAAWLAVVASLSGLMLFLLPAPLAEPKQIVAGIMLFIPFARLAGAPLALEWNRHR